MKNILQIGMDRLSEFTHLFKRDLRYIPKIYSGKPLLFYLGWVGFGNLGDEMLFIAHQKLFSEYELIVYHPFSLIRIFTALNKKRFKGCILGGGTLIDLPGVWFEGTSSLLKLKLPIFTLGTGVNFNIIQTTGEIAINESLKEWVQVLDQFNYLGIRGPISVEILRSLLKTPVEVIGDTAFTLAPATSPFGTERNIIGICIGHSREIPLNVGTDDYANAFISFIKTQIDKGFELVLLPVWEKDVEFNENILQKVNHKNLSIVKAYDDYQDYLSKVGECKVFIGQKLHGTVASTMMRIPSIMVSYHPKCLDYMESIGMGSLTISTHTVTANLLEKKLLEVLQNQVEIRQSLNSQIAHYKNAQYEKAKELKTTLLL